MNLLDEYRKLAKKKRWKEAIPVIKKIIERNPKIDTSWFNYGVCLDEIGRHSEAAEAFIKAQELNILDWGIHYRIFRSFFLAGDIEQFLEFAEYSCDIEPEMIHVLYEDEDFKELFNRDDFKKLKDKYTYE